MKIPFNRPYLIGTELQNIQDAIENHSQLAGNGMYTKACNQWLETHLRTKLALLTHSCTAALEMAALLLDLSPGDEVIMPSFTFVSTANAFVLQGAVPVFVDIRPDTLNIDETKIEAAITERTKAIVVVHYAGEACEMDEILRLTRKYGLKVVEDAAQALLSCYKGKKLGSIGDFGTISFHETKNIICGEGGALLVNNPDYIDRAQIIWEKGTNRQQFLDGKVDKYTWVDIGSSYLPGELTAAFLKAQLDNSYLIIGRRKEIFLNYYNKLKKLEEAGLLRLPGMDFQLDINGHIFYIIVNSAEVRTELLKFLQERGIFAVFHYIPLHSSPAGKRFGRASEETLPVTDTISKQIIRLPMFYELKDEEIEAVVEALFEFWGV